MFFKTKGKLETQHFTKKKFFTINLIMCLSLYSILVF